MSRIQKITPCLWFDGQAEAAAQLYTKIFPHSTIVSTSHYGKTGQEIHGRAPGTVMLVTFELDGQTFTALNGGPAFTFNEAISLQVHCDSQQEIDYYWEKLGTGGDASAQQCGWLKDRYGVSWQVVPAILSELLLDADAKKAERTMAAMLRMKKLDIEQLRRAHAG